MRTVTVGVSFKVDKTLRETFNRICEKEGYPASLVHRKLMEQYIQSKVVNISEDITSTKMTEEEFFTRIDKARSQEPIKMNRDELFALLRDK